MQIITIYQGASGSGEELADTVAQSLGYPRGDREALVKASLRYGVPRAKLTEVLEREPKWWDAFTRNVEPYRLALQAAFCELAAEQGIVYHGHLGHELVPKFRHVLKILLTAPVEMRVEQIQARQKVDEAAARRYVEAVDKARTRRLMTMFGADWRDPSRYDLIINLGYMSVETGQRLIVAAASSSDYQMNANSKQAFEDFALASRVRALLVHDGGLSHARIKIDAAKGQVAISGTIPDWVSTEDVIARAKRIPGVKDVKAELTNIPLALGLNE